MKKQENDGVKEIEAPRFLYFMKPSLKQTERRTDRALIEECKLGDRTAFRALYDAYQRRVFSTALHFLNGNRASAEDVTQDVFLRVFSRIEQFRCEADFGTWIYRITANACMDELRRARHAAAWDEARDKTPDWPDVWEQRETAREIQSAVAKLPPKLRIAVLMRHFMELSYEEIASALGCSAGTVASRLNRGHKLLAVRLSDLRPFTDGKE